MSFCAASAQAPTSSPTHPCPLLRNSAPALQYIHCGSGIEHAEGLGTPAGEAQEGFQIWVNTPSAQKMDAPRYGTHGASELPVVPLPGGATATLLAGALGGAAGPLVTRGADVFMADLALPAGGAVEHAVPPEHNTVLVYV